MHIYHFCLKRKIAESENIPNTYWTIRKFTFNLLVLILIDLQEVVHLDTRRRKSGQTSLANGVKQTLFCSCLLHNQEIRVGAKFELLVQREKK